MNFIRNSDFQERHSSDRCLRPGAGPHRTAARDHGRPGIFVFDESGREYMETVAGFSCAALGFSDEELVEAAATQMRKLPMSPHAHNRSTPVVMELAEKLVGAFPVANARVAFATTGSEANDNLVKMLWYGNINAGEPKRRKIVSRRSSYHGHSIFTNGMGGTAASQQAYGIPTTDHIHVSQPFGPAPGRVRPSTSPNSPPNSAPPSRPPTRRPLQASSRNPCPSRRTSASPRRDTSRR